MICYTGVIVAMCLIQESNYCVLCILESHRADGSTFDKVLRMFRIKSDLSLSCQTETGPVVAFLHRTGLCHQHCCALPGFAKDLEQSQEVAGGNTGTAQSELLLLEVPPEDHRQ